MPLPRERWLPPHSTGVRLVRLLLDADCPAAVIVQPLTAIPATNQSHPAATLDALLRGMTDKPTVALRQES
jgi:hypothetical protein